MNLRLERTEKDAIVLHAVFAILSLIVLFISLELSVGVRLCVLVVLYNVMIPAGAFLRRHDDWLALWLFLLPVSILQIFPDWFLAAELGVLVFPDTGSLRLGEVPLFMGGLWVIPLFVIVFLGRRIEERFNRKLGLFTVCITSFLLFVGSEAVLWRIPIWYAREVTTVCHVALYLIVPEVLLGLSAFLAFEMSRGRPCWYRLCAAFTVMVFYLGNLGLFYLIGEHLLLR